MKKSERYESAIDWFKTVYDDYFFRYPRKESYCLDFDMKYEFFESNRDIPAGYATKEARRWAKQELPKNNDRHLFDTEWRLEPFDKEHPTIIRIIRDKPNADKPNADEYSFPKWGEVPLF